LDGVIARCLTPTRRGRFRSRDQVTGLPIDAFKSVTKPIVSSPRAP